VLLVLRAIPSKEIPAALGTDEVDVEAGELRLKTREEPLCDCIKTNS
jgi:hypothetical protein